MKTTRAKRRPEYTLELGRIFVVEGPPGGLPLSPARNGRKSRRTGKQLRAKRDRLQPLVSRITNCILLARHIDAKGLEDVVEALHQAHSKALDHQFDRR